MRVKPMVPTGPPPLRPTLRQLLVLLAASPAPRPLLERDASMSRASAKNRLQELAELGFARYEIIENVYVWCITAAGTGALVRGSHP